MKKTLALICSVFFFSLTTMPLALAITDNDGDKYYSCEDNAVPPDCSDDTLPFGAKGWESDPCDWENINEDAVYAGGQPLAAPGVEVPGKNVNPGQIEGPNEQYDKNCDGQTTGYIPGNRTSDRDLMEVVGDIITWIGRIAVFISVGALIYGGIMFATATGEEMKIQKAKKTIIGAVVGLIVGLLAWNIVGFVTSTFG